MFPWQPAEINKISLFFKYSILFQLIFILIQILRFYLKINYNNLGFNYYITGFS